METGIVKFKVCDEGQWKIFVWHEDDEVYYWEESDEEYYENPPATAKVLEWGLK